MKPKQLKAVYTIAALLLGGAVSLHLVPPALEPSAEMALTYLLMHSFLPSAKTSRIG
jgi:hypothetical protein